MKLIVNLLPRKFGVLVYTTNHQASIVTCVRKSLTPPVIPQND